MNKTFLLCIVLLTAPLYGESLFQYNGKTYSDKNLPDAAKQTMYELDSRYFKLKKETIESEILIKLYVSELASKQGKPEVEVEKSLLKVKKVTDKDVKDFYEKNKARIPYPLEKVKNDIRSLVERESKGAAKKKLLQRIIKEKKVKFLISEPVAPTIAINDQDFPRKGKVGAKVKLIEFADYQCPHCKHAADVFKKLLPKYKDKVEFVYIDYPINPSGISKLVAKGAHCAGKQQKFWEYHYKAFDQQSSLTATSPAKIAKELKLDEKKFSSCFESKWASEVVEKGKAEGERIGISGTPSIFINGRKSSVGHDEGQLRSALDKELKRVSS